MKRLGWLLLVCWLACSVPQVWGQNTTVDDDPWAETSNDIRRPIRRLHPERELAKQREQLERELKAREQSAARDSMPQHTPSTTSPSGKPVTDKAWLQELLDTDYSLVQYLPSEPTAPVRLTWQDNDAVPSVESLRSKFEQRGNRYVPRGMDWGHRSSGFFAYVTTDSDGPHIHLRIQYRADDPLRFERVTVIVDGFDYAYIPHNKEQGRDGVLYWEVSDDTMTPRQRDLVYALAHGRWAMLKLHGQRDINHVKQLDGSQLSALSDAYGLFRALGGSL